MSLFGAIGSANASLRAVQAQLKVVSDNVAKSDDPDRTRHKLSNTVDGNGFVTTTQYSREMDAALRSEVEQLLARESGANTRADYMQKLGDLMGTTTGDPVINKYAEEFHKAWTTLETSPENEVAQYQLVQAANNFAMEINRLSGGVEKMASEMTSDLNNSMDNVNRLLRDINQINNDMPTLENHGEAKNSALDKRDALIRELSGYVDVRTMERPDGRIALFTSTGLSMLDGGPAQMRFDGDNIILTSGSNETVVSPHFKEGKIGALFSMLKDGSKSQPAEIASGDPTTELVRKLRSQLDTYAQMFTSPTKAGEPTSFADAYNNAKPVQKGELDEKFFMGDDRFSLRVNPKLVSNEAKIKQSALPEVVKSLNATGRTLVADGLELRDATYNTMVDNITGLWMKTSSNEQTKADLLSNSRELLQERLQGKTGVNIDEEIAFLQQLQTLYSASARVMQVANTMFDALERVV